MKILLLAISVLALASTSFAQDPPEHRLPCESGSVTAASLGDHPCSKSDPACILAANARTTGSDVKTAH